MLNKNDAKPGENVEDIPKNFLSIWGTKNWPKKPGVWGRYSTLKIGFSSL